MIDIPKPEMRSMADHHPERGNQVEAWLQHKLETIDCGVYEGPDIVEMLLEEYREAADSMFTLDEVVNGPDLPQPRELKKKPAKKLSQDITDRWYPR